MTILSLAVMVMMVRGAFVIDEDVHDKVFIGIIYDYDVFIGDDDDDVKLQRLHCTCAELTNWR